MGQITGRDAKVGSRDVVWDKIKQIDPWQGGGLGSGTTKAPECLGGGSDFHDQHSDNQLRIQPRGLKPYTKEAQCNGNFPAASYIFFCLWICLCQAVMNYSLFSQLLMAEVHNSRIVAN